MSEITVTVVGSTAPSALVTGSSTVNVTFADQASGVGNPAAATIQVGSVTTVAATESASVVNVGTAYAAKLDFAIPRGAMTGLKIGTVTSGTAAAASITGTAPSLSLNLTLPVGATGATGPANSLAIGTVASGTAAAASITGSAPSQVLSLTLPKGDTGATGPAAALAIGTVTVGTAAAASITGVAPSQILSLTLPPAPPNVLSIGTVTTTAGTAASATISGTSPSQVLSLVLPQGPTGNTGPAGPANSLSIGVVASGSSPAATLSGTAPNQVLNLVLPAGPQGATGATGAAGPANSLVIGSVVEGAAAGASITGAAPSQVLNLVMPVNSLSIGTVSSGTAAAAQITGNAPSQVLSLTLPQGAVGQTGPANSLSIGTVSQGTAAAATITGSAPSQTLSLTLPVNSLSIGTVSSGTAASAEITGSAPSQTLSLVLPVGPKGDTGEAGASTSVNGLTGSLSILGGSNVTVTTGTASITIAAAAGGGSFAWASVPANSSSSGNPGDQAYDSQYHYICVANSTWRASPLVRWDGDPYWSSTTFLMRFDGSNGSTSFTDLSATGATATAEGGAAVSTTQGKYGQSLALNGTNAALSLGNYGTAFSFSSDQDFTIEGWVYITANGTYHPFLEGRSTSSFSNYICGIYNTNGSLRLDFVTISGRLTGSTTAVALNSWTHVAWVRVNNYLRCYVNGVRDAEAFLYYGSLVPPSTVLVGRSVDPTYASGYYDEIRVTKAARYDSASFTPPSSPFAAF